MAYEPTTWQTGDVVTAEKMNKLEQGVANSGGGSLFVHVHVDENTVTMDKTWNEIKEALDNGMLAYVQDIYDEGVTINQIYSATINGGRYDIGVFVYENASSNTFSSYSGPNGYPAFANIG